MGFNYRYCKMRLGFVHLVDITRLNGGSGLLCLNETLWNNTLRVILVNRTAMSYTESYLDISGS